MNDDKFKSGIEVSFTRFLVERRLRRTPERYAILRKVLSMTNHFVIDELHQELEADGYHVSRATVYNTVSVLMDAGIVRRHSFNNQRAQYEKIVESSMVNHQHLLCLRCGKVKELKDPAIMKTLAESRYPSFSTEYFAVYIYGTCAQCQRKMRKAAKELEKSKKQK